MESRNRQREVKKTIIANTNAGDGEINRKMDRLADLNIASALP